MRAKEFANFNFDIEPYEAWSGEGVIVHAYDGKEEIGHVIFEPTDHDVTQWYAVDVEVEEPYQRLGIATKMYNMAKQAAKSAGAIIVKSHTQTDAGRGLWGDKKVWEQQVNEYKEYPTREYEGVTFTMKEKDGQLIVRPLNDYGISMGHVIFNMDGKILDPQDLVIADKYQGQGIAKVMYDYIKSLGFTIERSYDQTEAGKGFWDKHRGEDVRVWEDVNPDIYYSGFKHSQQIGDYLYTAKTDNNSGYGNQLIIKVYDGRKEIGFVEFVEEPEDKVLISGNTWVHKDYRNQGIATNMYAYAKMLGNDIVPSWDQTDQGERMWRSWNQSKQSKHILPKGHKGYNEIAEQELDEYSVTNDSIRTALSKKGYKFLGAGVDQSAYMEPSTGHVLKIFGTDMTDKFSDDHKMFFKWYQFCSKHQDNPYLPRFFGHESFMWPDRKYPDDQHRYLMIRTEPLKSSGKLGRQLANIVRNFDDYSFKEVINHQKQDSYFWSEIAKQMGGEENLINFLQTCYKLKQMGDRNRWLWDLHEGNIMMRADGTPIINDPWVI